jgi:hypothetical protein
MILDEGVLEPPFLCNFRQKMASNPLPKYRSMRLFRLSLCSVCLCVAGLRAQTNQADDDNKQAPPEEIPDFSQLDEYTYVPKSTLSIGDRLFLRGPKTTFSGQGAVPAIAYPADGTTPNIQRTYNDGYVEPDGRVILVTDGVGSGTTTPAASDGRTNTWGYDNNSQVLPNGDIAFHSYSANVTDTTSHEENGTSTAGLELILDRDMGKIGKHLKWSLTAGLSLADIRSNISAVVPGTLYSLTDTYDLFGQIPPPAVYNSPATVASSSGTVADTSTLIGNVPVGRTSGYSATTVTNRYFTNGAYYTFRVGPTVTLPMGKHWNFNVSAGPALIFAGAEMNVLEDLAVATGESDLQDLYQKENNKVVPGYYVDVDLQYQLTDTSGFYVGGVYQGAGTFSQSVSSGPGTAYDSKIDFGSQEGVKTGMTVRF